MTSREPKRAMWAPISRGKCCCTSRGTHVKTAHLDMARLACCVPESKKPKITRSRVFHVFSQLFAKIIFRLAERSRKRNAVFHLGKRANQIGHHPPVPERPFGTVEYLQKVDKEEFNSGDWQTNSRYSTESENLRKRFVKLIKELEEKDQSDDDVDEKFVWQWWEPAKTKSV